ncbi:MAG: hypothetical protein LR000_01225 [Candidatus Pacebacteria bacterium]|nr:hypothetical protein [Candidatus Paceibacterota bacterium]
MRKKILKTLFLEGIIVILIFVLGLASAKRAEEIMRKENIEMPTLTVGEFLFLFFLGTGLILFLVYFKKLKKIRGKFFKIAYFLSGAYGSLVVFSLIFSYLPENFLFTNLLPLIFCGFLLFWRIKKPNFLNHNLFIGLGLVGISAILGLSFQPETLLILLAMLSIYDFIAVFKTKHMQKMATSMLESGSMMGLIVPFEVRKFNVSVERIKPGREFIILGGGDIAFPLMFASSLIPQYGIINASIVAFFAFFGIFFTLFFFLLQKKRRPIPALPPIALFSIIGYLVILFL